MANAIALIFGNNKYAYEILSNVKDKYQTVKIYSLNKEDTYNKEQKVEHFDLSDESMQIKECVDTENSIAFCVLEDTAENIFLTISLRENFPDLTIMAISSNKESANKLKMAGANKVISLVETTADIIANMLKKPISNKVLNDILYGESELKIAQIKIGDESHVKDEHVSSIDWSRYNGVIILSIMHKDMKSDFIYSSRAKHRIIESGDILVVVGYENDIQEFEKKIGSKRYVNWNHWSW